MDGTALKIAIEAKSRAELLEERLDRHLTEVRDQGKSLAEKVDNINETMSKIHVDLLSRIGDTREDHLKADKETNLKIYTVNAGITTFLYAIFEFFTSLFKSKGGQ